MNSPPLSVVMVVCNVERFLAESVESILTQSFTQFEFIVVDFGSTDDSYSIISSYAAKDSRMKIHTIPHCSLAEARNTGCVLAQGRYFAIMDADDVSTPDRLKLEFEFMERNPEIGLVGGGTEWIDEAGRVLLRDNHFPAENHKIRAALLTESPFCQPTVLIRREAFIEVGGYRAAFVEAEDYDLWLRIAERFEVANLPRVVLKYRIHPGQVSVARWRSQALCAAGARAAALARKSGKPDPLEGVKEITLDILKMLGVSEGLLQTTLARGYLSCVRNMCRAGQYSLAIDAVESFHFGDFTHADTWVIAESYLWAARLYWQQRKFARSMSSAVHAVVKRPIILGRPIKRLAPRFSTIFEIKPGNTIYQDNVDAKLPN